MKTVKRLLMLSVFAIGVSAAGCGDSEGDKMMKIAEEYCACEATDTECQQKAGNKIQSLDKSKFEASDLKKFTEATKKISECQQKNMGKIKGGAAGGGN